MRLLPLLTTVVLACEPVPGADEAPDVRPAPEAPPAPDAPPAAASFLAGYDFDERLRRFDLPGRLDEVSGLAFSPDERILHITDSGANQAPGTYFIHLPHHIRAFDVDKGRHLRGDRLFATISPGYPDGIKVDTKGRVFSSSATGVQVFSPDGDLLGELAAPGVHNFTFGGPDDDVLFILGDTKIWQAHLNARGARPALTS